MVRPPDCVVLFGVLLADDGWTLRSLADRLHLPLAKVQRGLQRLGAARIFDGSRRRAVPGAAEEFVLHAVKYLHPVEEGRLGRGVPTAWGAAPLRDELVADDPPPVWSSPHGKVVGPLVEPLDPVLPLLADSWPEVAELAALTDAFRLGDARSRRLAEDHLGKRLTALL